MNISLANGFTLDAGQFPLSPSDPSLQWEEELSQLGLDVHYAVQAMETLRLQGRARSSGREDQPVLFPHLPEMNRRRPGLLQNMVQWSEEIKEYDNLIAVGIGGSYLGGKMLVDALCHPQHNLLSKEERGGAPRIFFAGDNLDPYDLNTLLEMLDPQKTAVLVISKSGGTVEPLSAFMVLAQWMGEGFAGRLTLVTDPHTGPLREYALKHGARTFPVDPGVGGRWSVLSPAGMLVAGAAGVNLEELLGGARDMAEETTSPQVSQNPAYLYACLAHLAHRYGRHESVIMPYSKRLWSFALWYVQLLSESLGKKKRRDGLLVNTGRTPIPALGTTDMHSQTQLHQDGPHNKIITFLQLNNHESSITIPGIEGGTGVMENLQGRQMEGLLAAALDANVRALSDDRRPTLTISIPQLTPFSLGGLIYFFEMTVAFEGELLDVDAYDQPGVEAYKYYLKQWLRS